MRLLAALVAVSAPETAAASARFFARPGTAGSSQVVLSASAVVLVDHDGEHEHSVPTGNACSAGPVSTGPHGASACGPSVINRDAPPGCTQALEGDAPPEAASVLAPASLLWPVLDPGTQHAITRALAAPPAALADAAILTTQAPITAPITVHLPTGAAAAAATAQEEAMLTLPCALQGFTVAPQAAAALAAMLADVHSAVGSAAATWGFAWGLGSVGAPSSGWLAAPPGSAAPHHGAGGVVGLPARIGSALLGRSAQLAPLPLPPNISACVAVLRPRRRVASAELAPALRQQARQLATGAPAGQLTGGAEVPGGCGGGCGAAWWSARVGAPLLAVGSPFGCLAPHHFTNTAVQVCAGVGVCPCGVIVSKGRWVASTAGKRTLGAPGGVQGCLSMVLPPPPPTTTSSSAAASVHLQPPARPLSATPPAARAPPAPPWPAHAAGGAPHPASHRADGLGPPPPLPSAPALFTIDAPTQPGMEGGLVLWQQQLPATCCRLPGHAAGGEGGSRALAPAGLLALPLSRALDGVQIQVALSWPHVAHAWASFLRAERQHQRATAPAPSAREVCAARMLAPPPHTLSPGQRGGDPAHAHCTPLLTPPPRSHAALQAPPHRAPVAPRHSATPLLTASACSHAAPLPHLAGPPALPPPRCPATPLAQAVASVVLIRTPHSWATGVVVAATGLVLTNAHLLVPTPGLVSPATPRRPPPQQQQQQQQQQRKRSPAAGDLGPCHASPEKAPESGPRGAGSSGHATSSQAEGRSGEVALRRGACGAAAERQVRRDGASATCLVRIATPPACPAAAAPEADGAAAGWSVRWVPAHVVFVFSNHLDLAVLQLQLPSDSSALAPPGHAAGEQGVGEAPPHAAAGEEGQLPHLQLPAVLQWQRRGAQQEGQSGGGEVVASGGLGLEAAGCGHVQYGSQRCYVVGHGLVGPGAGWPAAVTVGNIAQVGHVWAEVEGAGPEAFVRAPHAWRLMCVWRRGGASRW